MNEEQYIETEKWWSELEQKKALRASLRRKINSNSVVFEGGFHEIYRKISSINDNINMERFSSVVGIISHIKSNEGESFGAQLGEPDKNSPKLSEIRFKKLLSIDDRGEMYVAIIRILRQFKHIAPIKDVAKIAYWWNDSTKRQLAKDYYQAASKFRGDEE